MKEPIISINGFYLAPGQALSLRVAAVAYMADMVVDGLGEDEHGRQMARFYHDWLTEAVRLMDMRERPPEQSANPLNNDRRLVVRYADALRKIRDVLDGKSDGGIDNLGRLAHIENILDQVMPRRQT